MPSRVFLRSLIFLNLTTPPVLLTIPIEKHFISDSEVWTVIKTLKRVALQKRPNPRIRSYGINEVKSKLHSEGEKYWTSTQCSSKVL